MKNRCLTEKQIAKAFPIKNKTGAERLGHSTIVLTLDTYSPVLPTMQQRATDKLEQMMFG